MSTFMTLCEYEMSAFFFSAHMSVLGSKLMADSLYTV